ncbi:hypothetical protein BJ742DRAFT_686727, partial [Cladochytrium replicatum]
VTDFLSEIGLALALVVYMIYYYLNSEANVPLVKAWYDNTDQIWSSNFAAMGNPDAKVIKDSPRDYVFYATGRMYVKYLYGYLRVILPRHDLLQSIIEYVWPIEHDELVYKIALNDNESDDFVFAIVRKDKYKEISKERWDLETFGKPRTDLPNFPHQYYTLVTDAPEFATQVVSEPRIIKALWAAVGLNDRGQGTPLKEPYLESIELTDMPAEKPASLEELEKAVKTLTIKFRLPKLVPLEESEAERLKTLTQLVIDIIDSVGQFGKLPLEALYKEKLEEKKKRDEALAKLTPDERRRQEDKERKKEVKKNLKRGKIVM